MVVLLRSPIGHRRSPYRFHRLSRGVRCGVPQYSAAFSAGPCGPVHPRNRFSVSDRTLYQSAHYPLAISSRIAALFCKERIQPNARGHRLTDVPWQRLGCASNAVSYKLSYITNSRLKEVRYIYSKISATRTDLQRQRIASCIASPRAKHSIRPVIAATAPE